jgi:hypothetical protein
MKSFLDRMVVPAAFIVVVAFIFLLLYAAFQPIEAQPASQIRLRDLNDVRIATTPANGAALVWNSAANRWTNGIAGSTGSFTNALANPFTTNVTTVTPNTLVSVDNAGVPHGNGVTAQVVWNSLFNSLDKTGLSGSALVFANSPVLSSVTNASLTPSTLVYADATKKESSAIIGYGLDFTAGTLSAPLLLSQNGTNGAPTINFTNSATVTWTKAGTNWQANVAVVGPAGETNYYDFTFITNNIFLSGKGNTLIVTQALTIQAIKTNLLATTSTGLVTNANYGTGVSWDPSTLTLSASGGGGSAGSTNYRSPVVTLTMTGTNVDAGQIDWARTNQCYRLTLTNSAFFGDTVCTNVPDTNSFQWLQLDLVQDATGGRKVTFTNSIFAGVNGTFAITTNASAWDSCTLINSRQTNGNVAVLPSNNLHR